METVNAGPKTLHVEHEHGKPARFQCALFWCITLSDELIIWLLSMPTSINCLIRCACVSRIMLCGKLWLGITLIICNENKYNPTVDFNKLTQFSTSCLMWLKVITQLSSQGSREHVIGFSNAFVWRVIEVYFPLLWALTCTSKSNNGFPPCSSKKKCFPICETLT